MEARRPFEREPGERVEPRLVESEAPATGRFDLVRWGPIWAGFFVTLGTTALLLMLGTAVAVSVMSAGAATPGTAGGGLGFWAPISLIIGLFVGGWAMMRASGVGGTFAALTHGTVLWAVTLVVGTLLATLGVGALGAALTGFVGPAGITPGGGPEAAPGMQGPLAAWGAFIGLLLALGAAMLGAWVGNPEVRPARREERAGRAAA